MTARGQKLICQGGPYDGRVFVYPSPMPNLIVIADHRLQYHQYRRLGPARLVYRWECAYQVCSDGTRLHQPVHELDEETR